MEFSIKEVVTGWVKPPISEVCLKRMSSYFALSLKSVTYKTASVINVYLLRIKATIIKEI